MAYTPLDKVYYQNITNREAYEEEYRRRLGSPSTLVLDFSVHGDPAFVMMTPQIVELVAAIMEASGAVMRIELPGIAIAQFSKKSVIDEIHQTLEIEHVHSTRREITDLLDGRVQNKNQRLRGMVSKYTMLIGEESIPLDTSSAIRALYDELCLPEVLEEDEGNRPDGTLFRKGPVSVRSKHDRPIHEGLFPEAAILTAMEKALRILHDKSMNILIRIAVFHYMFGYIHPFYDGNGRMARFISSYMLAQKLDPYIGVRLSFTIKNNVDHYHRMFKQAGDKKNRGDLTLFVEDFLNIITKAYANLIDALMERRKQLDFYGNMLEQVFPPSKERNVAYVLLQITLFGDSGMRADAVAEYANLSRRTIDSVLKQLGTLGLLSISREGRSNLYALDTAALEQASSPLDASPIK